MKFIFIFVVIQIFFYVSELKKFTELQKYLNIANNQLKVEKQQPLNVDQQECLDNLQKQFNLI